MGGSGPSPNHQPPAQTSLWSVSQSLYTGRPHTRAATRPIAPPRHLSEGGRTEETLAAENERKTLIRARALSPRSSLLLGQACSPLPARSANWYEWPLLGVLLFVFGEHFLTWRLVALREGGRAGETLATENKRNVPIRAPAHVHSAHAALCCWGMLAAHSQPALLGVLLYVFGE